MGAVKAFLNVNAFFFQFLQSRFAIVTKIQGNDAASEEKVMTAMTCKKKFPQTRFAQ